MATYDRLAELPIQIEGYSLEGLERQVTSEFSRLSTLIRMHGGDVTVTSEVDKGSTFTVTVPLTPVMAKAA